MHKKPEQSKKIDNQNQTAQPGSRQVTIKLSTNQFETFRSALAWHMGYVPEDEEVESELQQLTNTALAYYINSTQRENDNPIIV